jgi:putative oxidoreductase
MLSDSSRLDDRPAGLDAGLLAARILIVALFLVAGYYKLIDPARNAAYFGSLGLPMPAAIVWVAVAIEIVLPLMILFGIGTRWAALGLLVFTIASAFIGHRFWTFDQATQFGQYFAQLSNFLKNLAIAGGLGLLALVGPGRYAVESRGRV